MPKYLASGIAGFAGAIARYVLGSHISQPYGVRFSYGALVINRTGCFLIGFILVMLDRTQASPYWRDALPIGLIGAYTTWSTFEYETLRAFLDGRLTISLLNIFLGVIIGFAAV